MPPKPRIPTDGTTAFRHDPFAALSSAGLPPAADPPVTATPPPPPQRANRGRVDLRRSTAGRGGKTVTVISGFIGMGLREKEELAHMLRKACGTGGTVKDGAIEIQGDHRTQLARLLSEAGFRPVFAGG